MLELVVEYNNYFYFIIFIICIQNGAGNFSIVEYSCILAFGMFCKLLPKYSKQSVHRDKTLKSANKL